VNAFIIRVHIEFNALEFDTNELELVEKGGNSDVYFKLACLFLARKDFTFVQYGQYDVDTTKTPSFLLLIVKICKLLICPII
jgi:hypothetical protein